MTLPHTPHELGTENARSDRDGAPSSFATAFLDVLAVFGAAVPQPAPEQRGLAREYTDFMRASADVALDRTRGREHVTASCFVFSPDLTRVLLTHHRKGRFWVQFGGHVEPGDASIAASALREGREESGIADLQLLAAVPVDLDRHTLGDGFARCSVHWDVGFVAVVAADAVPSVSDESDDVAWWPVAALPEPTPSGFGERLTGVLRRIDSR